ARPAAAPPADQEHDRSHGDQRRAATAAERTEPLSGTRGRDPQADAPPVREGCPIAARRGPEPRGSGPGRRQRGPRRRRGRGGAVERDDEVRVVGRDGGEAETKALGSRLLDQTGGVVTERILEDAPAVGFGERLRPTAPISSPR